MVLGSATCSHGGLIAGCSTSDWNQTPLVAAIRSCSVILQLSAAIPILSPTRSRTPILPGRLPLVSPGSWPVGHAFVARQPLSSVTPSASAPRIHATVAVCVCTVFQDPAIPVPCDPRDHETTRTLSRPRQLWTSAHQGLVSHSLESVRLQLRVPQPSGLTLCSRFSPCSVVLVHGLDAVDDRRRGCIKTWTAEDGTVWPRDLLPARMPEARVLCYEYNGSIRGATSIAGTRDHARSLLQQLEDYREGKADGSRPIIFVGHSLGGIMFVSVIPTLQYTHADMQAVSSRYQVSDISRPKPSLTQNRRPSCLP